MTELPPIIERLDAEWRDNPVARAVDCTHIKFMDAYPELRAELLRLQEERDRAEKMCREYIPHLRHSRDALLEALKPLLAGPPVYRDHGGTDFRTCGYCHNPIEDYNHQHADWCPWERAHAAIASVEGKE